MSEPLVRLAGLLLFAGGLACSEPSAAAPPSETPPEPTEPRTAAPASTPDEGCVSSVTELPASPRYEPGDLRLRESSLLVAHKSVRRLMLFERGSLRACFPMGLGFEPRGHKQVEGDGRTPEGWYQTSDKPWSDFPGAIAIHYPNEVDAKAARADGRLSEPVLDAVLGSLAHDQIPPQQTALGGEVLIHGGGSGQDWTLGCMALSDEDLDQLRGLLPEDKRVSLLVLP